MSGPQVAKSHNGVSILIDAADTIAGESGSHGNRYDESSWPGHRIGPNGDGHQADSQAGLLHQRQSAHQCRICQRAYERADHLTRHLKSHENARPFQCQRCLKSFNRVDLLTRHVATHVRNARPGVRRTDIRRTERAGQACVPCAMAKARCEDRKPCQRCRKKNIACVAAAPMYNSTAPAADMIESQNLSKSCTTSPRSSTGLVQRTITVQGTTGNGPAGQPFATNALSADDQAHINSALELSTNDHATTYAQIFHETFEPQAVPYGVDVLPMNTNDINFNGIMDEMLFFLPPTDFNNQNLDFGFQDFNFQDDDLKIAAGASKHIAIAEAASSEPAMKASVNGRDVSRGHAAFTRSPWLWTPAPKDHILSDQRSLELNEESMPSTLTPKSTASRNDAPSSGFPSIDAGLRDKMFYLVSTMNKYAKGIPSFPSRDILNHIFEAFFVRHSYQVDTWIHVPTISLTTIHPEFLIALVTAGSTVISVPAIWKMGLVLLDVVRVTVGELWERENSQTRALQPLQAWMLSLDTGLWSGFQRQMELAESFSQPLITMMRRGGILAAPIDTHALMPKDLDCGHALEAKWKKWAERESFKRLSLHLFMHDTRSSIALQKSPLVSLTEISFSAPACQTLFLAGSALEWKEKCLQLQHSSMNTIPKLVDALHDLSILEDFHQELDINLCYTALLHGFWSQIWAFRESCKFYTVGDSIESVHRLWLATQQRELYREVEEFRDKLLAVVKPQQELVMTAELFLMILHVSPEELQRFAGKAGEEAASQSMVTLEQWSTTENSRRAIWHAGQVFRWALLMPPAELRDFYAIAVYFASLTLWTYGNLSNSMFQDKAKQSSGTLSFQDIHSTSSVALLNGLDSRESRAFISKGLGRPGLTSSGSFSPSGEFVGDNTTFVPLDNPNSVLKTARDLYRGNFPVYEEPLPPLVENMGNLMRDLSSLPGSRFSRCVSPIER